jgi:Flp pilus assembly protein TadG
MTKILRHFVSDCRGAAAAEMALITPLLITLMFGSMELGNYFMGEHAVVKAVRDGARYAGRIPISNYTCATGNATGTLNALETEVKNLTRTGSIGGNTSPRLGYWTDNTTITVSVRCVAKASFGGTFSPLLGDIPVVKVSADVPYADGSLFKYIGFTSIDLSLRSESEATVMGI